MVKFFLAFFLLSLSLQGQLSFSETDIVLGNLEEAYEIKGDLVITNLAEKKVFLMRADADRGVKIYTSKKTLNPQDTCLLIISFLPETSGNFRKKIQLVSTDKTTPYVISLSGHLKRVKTNDRMACVYFGKQKPARTTLHEEPIVVPAEPVKRDQTNRIPDASASHPVVVQEPQTKPTLAPKTKEVPSDPLEGHKPNNLIFLVDVSSSMRDSLKLPVMKKALHHLIDAVREIDSISFVSYASKVLVLEEAVSGKDKARLHRLVDTLKAKGMTAGSKAILISEDLAHKHFIPAGNNQIILATDGEFQMSPENKALWLQKQKKKKITLSTVAFGDDKKALRNLKELAQKGDGSFIHFDGSAQGEALLFQEVEMRSRN